MQGSKILKWLDFAQAKALGDCLPKVTEIQQISLVADTTNLPHDIPISPDLIPVSDGPPAPLNRWYGAIDNRVFSVDCSTVEIPNHPPLVCIFTPYLDCQKELGDWSVLVDFLALPGSILIRRPVSISSRCTNAQDVVYRSSGKGWFDPVYLAANQSDAENLLHFLQNDDAAAVEYLIGPQEPCGEWRTIQGERAIAGYGSDLHVALRFASEWSARYAPKEFLVKDVSGKCNHLFHARAGVIHGPSPKEW